MKILAIVVTYYPEKELLEKNISAFINHVDKVLIWENTPEQEKLNYRFIEHEKVEYHGDGINSISHGLNYGWQYAKKYGYDYLLTMDQDSVFENFYFYLQQTIFNLDTPKGIWGPEAYGDKPKEIIESDKIITSGMLLSVELINRIGGWNEMFSVDCVDNEFCLRAKKDGIKTYIIGMSRLYQRYGKPKKVTFWGRSNIINYDSPGRLYSIYKNYVLLMRLFPENTKLKKEFWDGWIPLIKWTVVFGDKPIENLFAIIRGIISGRIEKI